MSGRDGCSSGRGSTVDIDVMGKFGDSSFGIRCNLWMSSSLMGFDYTGPVATPRTVQLVSPFIPPS